jgi:hypothetical protein
VDVDSASGRVPLPARVGRRAELLETMDSARLRVALELDDVDRRFSSDFELSLFPINRLNMAIFWSGEGRKGEVVPTGWVRNYGGREKNTQTQMLRVSDKTREVVTS